MTNSTATADLSAAIPDPDNELNESNRLVVAEWQERWDSDLHKSLRTRVRDTIVGDLKQATYHRLLEARDLHKVRSPRAYLMRTGANVASDWYKRLKRQNRRGEVDWGIAAAEVERSPDEDELDRTGRGLPAPELNVAYEEDLKYVDPDWNDEFDSVSPAEDLGPDKDTGDPKGCSENHFDVESYRQCSARISFHLHASHYIRPLLPNFPPETPRMNMHDNPRPPCEFVEKFCNRPKLNRGLIWFEWSLRSTPRDSKFYREHVQNPYRLRKSE